jgi:hypothetical protein
MMTNSNDLIQSKPERWKFWLFLSGVSSFSILCILCSALIVSTWLESRAEKAKDESSNIEIHFKRPPGMKIYSSVEFTLNGARRWNHIGEAKVLQGDSISYELELDENIRPDSILSAKLFHHGLFGARFEILFTEKKTSQRSFPVAFEYINDTNFIKDRDSYKASCDSLSLKFSELRQIMDHFYGEKWKYQIQYEIDSRKLVDSAKLKQ